MKRMKIKSIKKIQNTSKRYDIEVRDNHNFFANKMLVHNCSSTFYSKDGKFGFCGRNWEFKPETKNTYSEIVKKYHLDKKLEELKIDIAIQGEIVGPGIQGNKYKLSEHKLFLFHAYDIERQEYYSHDNFMALCDALGVDSVPVIGDMIFDSISVEDLLKMAEGESKLYKTQREGIVIKSRYEERDVETGRLSFKVISNKFLMKHNE